MDHVSYVKSKVKTDYWKKIVADCQASGKTNIAYCEENDINIKSYYYWLRKIREQACNGIDYSAPINENKYEFAQIQLPAVYQNTIPAIKLHIGKIIIEIADGVSQDTISHVLNGIRKIC